MTDSSQTNLIARRDKLYSQFIEMIETYENGIISGRGLNHMAEQATSSQEVERLNDELLLHTFWATRHIIHRPACWAPKPEELHYLLQCLRGEEQFNQEVADHYRK